MKPNPTSVRSKGVNGGVDDNNNDSGSDKCHSAAGRKYQLRPRVLQPGRHSDSEWNLTESLRHKQRPPPLSRYRRKTANARERYRMRQINRAFESLRGVLPAWVCSRRATAHMTKITTLRLASAYIRSLQDILEGGVGHDSSWVLAGILADAGATRAPTTSVAAGDDATPHDADLLTLLCSAGDATMLHDEMDLTCLGPMSETEAMALLLGSESRA